MRVWRRLVVVLVVVLIELLTVVWVTPAIAMDAETPVPSAVSRVSATSSSTPFLEKLQRLQEDKQLQELVEKDLERSITIRSQIQEEVDRAFNHTTTLLNVLLAVLTCLPVLAAVSIWFIRRSVLNQIIAETKRQLREEVENQLEAEVTAELKQQAEAFQKKLEQLETEFQAQLAQLKTLFSDAQKQKDQIIQELAQLTPSLVRESAHPEVQAKIQVLTQQLEKLKSGNVGLSFTANDYVEQGKAFYFENRNDDAIACYDKALQLEPDNPKAWFSRGAVLVKLQQLEPALAAYDRALALKPDLAEAWFGRGTVLAKQQNLDAAIAAYTHATDVKPDFFPAWFGKARCYALQNELDLALASLQPAMQLNPERTKEALKTDTAFEPLRAQEPFQALLKS
ncbi:MAG: tetratricopeptide repeat protein [Leptolyngbyaceae cyanobacterium bins.349]|nr:tetratricopeptide repeat protein [Leptolyngbyaceae cyanobacterium bins.349]